VNDDLYQVLKPGTKVAVNNALSIVKIVGNIFDQRVRVMELEEAPEITFDQVGGLTHEIEEIREAVEYPLTRPETFERIGVEPPKGILLYGPPGTGKTLIAKAVAHEAEATFIRMSGSELVHKYIGEGAQLVRELFTLARERAPSIVFIDEMDAVGSTRTNGRNVRECRGPADPDAAPCRDGRIRQQGGREDHGWQQTVSTCSTLPS